MPAGHAPRRRPPTRSCWSTATTRPWSPRRSARCSPSWSATSDRDLAVEDFGGEEVDLAAVADSCATPPFLADRRIVVVRDVGRFSTDEVAPLLAYLEDPLPTHRARPGRRRGHGRPQAGRRGQGPGSRGVDQGGGPGRPRLGAGPDPGGAAAARRAGRGARSRPTWARMSAVWAPCSRCWSPPTARAPGWVRPRSSPTSGRPARSPRGTFTDAIDAGRTADALAQLHRLLGGGERHPLVVLAILHRHVQSLLRVDSPAIRTEAQAAEAMGIARGGAPIPAKKALAASRRWGSAAIAEAMGLVADAELDLKGASAWPPEAVLEVLVARLCRLARPGAGPPSRSPRRGVTRRGPRPCGGARPAARPRWHAGG